MQTYFYVIGGALVVIALAISFIGMRSESFPSNTMLRLGIVFVAAVVIATAYGAVKSSQDEQQKREDEQNREASSAEVAQTADNQASGVQDAGGSQAPGDRQQTDTSQAGSGSTTTPVASGDPQAGAQVFVDQSCGSCHSLQAANATGTIGPNLDEVLASKDTTFIQTSIVDPSAFVEQGFQDGIMPQDFGDVLTPDDLANLVAYLSQSTSSVKGQDAAGSKSGSAKK